MENYGIAHVWAQGDFVTRGIALALVSMSGLSWTVIVVKGWNVVRLKRKKQVMKAARGAFGARSKLWKAAKENVERGWKYAYRDRKNKKREFRRLWIVRINAGARQNDMSYSVFMNGLKRAGIEIDRKVLSDLAINDAAAFGALAEKARAALNAA